ncbi:MAG TPA: hypothetical protein VGQ12_10920 [Candidatus Angelobacter sp.]|jgi:hypothetical protein|nr:hypothetical protein [Candidatus Angelobacter sp.]
MRYTPANQRLDTQFRFYEIKRVFLACPGDLSAERSKFMRLLETVNNLRAHSLGFHLQAVGWERVIPSHGRPQSLINQELDAADLVVVMFWNRIGSPTSDNSPETGTMEEYKRARSTFQRHGFPTVWVYFKTPTAEIDDQLKGVSEFRRALEKGRDIFFRDFSTTAEWEEMFREHLVAYLDALKRWQIEANFESMRPQDAILHGRFLGEGVYNWGSPLTFAIDLDGDGNDEHISFYHDHGAEGLRVTRFDKGLYLSLPQEMAYVDSPRSNADVALFHVALKDVNSDGLPEILIANRPSVGEVAVGIWGFKGAERELRSDTFGLLGVLKGQYDVYVFEGGQIRLPYGSIGASFAYRWSGDHFEKTHED